MEKPIEQIKWSTILKWCSIMWLMAYLLIVSVSCKSAAPLNHHHHSVDDRLREVEMPDTIPSFSGLITVDPQYFGSLYIEPEKIDTVAVYLLVTIPDEGFMLYQEYKPVGQVRGYCVGTKYYPCEKYLREDKTKVPGNWIIWNAVNRN